MENYKLSSLGYTDARSGRALKDDDGTEENKKCIENFNEKKETKSEANAAWRRSAEA